MAIRGYEISQFWFYVCIALVSVSCTWRPWCLTVCCQVWILCIEFIMHWSHDLTLAGLWYLIPEAIFVALLLLWMGTAVVAAYRKEPGCSCYRAVALYLDSGAAVNLAPRLLRRIPVFIGRAFLSLFLVTFFPSIYFVAAQRTDLRARLMFLVCTSSGLYGLMQHGHSVCSLYYYYAILQLNSRQMQESFESGGREIRDQGPVDMTPFRKRITELERAREENCAICTDGFAPNEAVASLPCGHMFHEVCAESWIRRVASCPLCRTAVAVERAPQNVLVM